MAKASDMRKNWVFVVVNDTPPLQKNINMNQKPMNMNQKPMPDCVFLFSGWPGKMS